MLINSAVLRLGCNCLLGTVLGTNGWVGHQTYSEIGMTDTVTLHMRSELVPLLTAAGANKK